MNQTPRATDAPERDTLDPDIYLMLTTGLPALVARSERTWTRARIVRGIFEYLCFWQLVRDHQDRAIVPSPDADAVWHVALQDLGPYLAACQAVFGKTMLHFPWAGARGAADAAQQSARFADSTLLLNRLAERVMSRQPLNVNTGVKQS